MTEANLQEEIKILIGIRKHVLSQVSGLSNSELTVIPEGFHTNILWQLGHMVASQQILHYTLAQVEPLVDDTFLGNFRKGSSPSQWKEIPDAGSILELFTVLPEQLALDYSAKKFENFNSYKTSAGITLNSINESLAYNNYHEGIHTGKIECILKLL